jgi:multidrug efflux pump subunit AcrA (membrane-fusion protein)
MTKYLTMLLAVAGLVLGGVAIVQTKHDPPVPPLAGTASVNPFGRGIAASGVVEASTRNIAVSAAESGLVAEVLVQVGDTVEAGQPLFRLDDRALRAELVRAEAVRQVAEAQLAQLEARPRKEEGPPIAAARDAARARLADAEDWYQSTMDAARDNAASKNEISRRRFAMDTARAELAETEARYALWEAGSWSPEVEVARVQVAAAAADIEAIKLRLDRLIARSPVAGSVLKRNVEPGQHAPSNLAASTGVQAGTVVVGDLATLHVRARVDEEDVAKLTLGAAAKARQRGAAEAEIPLTMLRIEPLAIAKRDLTGDNTERVDTRVIEVIFRVDPSAPAAPAGSEPTRPVRLYPGQLLDVFIDVGA